MSARVKLHPATIKYLKKGHPWVTKDKFSMKFPRNYLFLTGNEGPHKDFCTLLNDPDHPQVKARLWSFNPVTTQNFFEKELFQRIDTAFNKRINKKIHEQRDNFYLIFGEADELPGLHIQKLGPCIFFQYYANYWIKYERKILKHLLKLLRENFPEPFFFWRQGRNKDQEKNLECLSVDSPSEFDINEYGVTYQIKIDENYDAGLYTDMSAIRGDLKELVAKSNSLLNLYAYTGAFSLFALKQGVKSVTSVDLSKKYLDWLESNLEINKDLNKEHHQSMCMPTAKALNKLATENKKFDFIVCDPPSYSSDGKKRTSSFDSYKTALKQMSDLLSGSGSHLLIFINTHKITRRKFNEHIEKIIKEQNLPLKVAKSYKLNSDCPTLKGFHEGDYLKGLLLTHK